MNKPNTISASPLPIDSALNSGTTSLRPRFLLALSYPPQFISSHPIPSHPHTHSQSLLQLTHIASRNSPTLPPYKQCSRNWITQPVANTKSCLHNQSINQSLRVLRRAATCRFLRDEGYKVSHHLRFRISICFPVRKMSGKYPRVRVMLDLIKGICIQCIGRNMLDIDQNSPIYAAIWICGYKGSNDKAPLGACLRLRMKSQKSVVLYTLVA